jgi:hypothetical protein
VPTKSILTAANVPIIAAIMFLRCKVRRKDGKQHRYWSVVENTRVAGRRVVQRHVLYLSKINDSQESAWRRSIEVLEDGAARPRTLSLFPEDRVEGLLTDASIVGVKLSEPCMRSQRHQMRQATRQRSCALMQLEQPGSALQRGQQAGLKASCARRALLPIAQVVQKGDSGLELAGNLSNVSVKYRAAIMAIREQPIAAAMGCSFCCPEYCGTRIILLLVFVVMRLAPRGFAACRGAADVDAKNTSEGRSI